MFKTIQFAYNPNTSVLVAEASDLGLTRFPKAFKIQSSHTGKVIEFFEDLDKAIDMEFWDGEMMEYINTVEPDIRVVILND